MKWLTKTRTLAWYGILFSTLFFIDRLTKYLALSRLSEPHTVSDWLSFNLVFNRGMSWSMLSSDNPTTFFMVSCIIFLVILILLGYTGIRWANHNGIVGETLVLAGAFSNIIDRLWYGGVADFILLSHGSWSFPTFNVADIGIVVGIFIMVVGIYRES